MNAIVLGGGALLLLALLSRTERAAAAKLIGNDPRSRQPKPPPALPADTRPPGSDLEGLELDAVKVDIGEAEIASPKTVPEVPPAVRPATPKPKPAARPAPKPAARPAPKPAAKPAKPAPRPVVAARPAPPPPRPPPRPMPPRGGSGRVITIDPDRPAVTRSPKQAATDLRGYVTPLLKAGKGAQLGTKGKPNPTVLAAQRDMGGMSPKDIDGIYGPATRKRSAALGIPLPVRN